ncbi:MAG: PAS domain-containing protein, partial [Pirellulales bacterium]
MSQDELTFWKQADWSRVALNSIGDAVIVSDALSRVVFMNPVAETLTGWSQAEAVGRPLPAVFRIINERTRQPVEDPVAKVLTSGVVLGLANHTLLPCTMWGMACGTFHSFGRCWIVLVQREMECRAVGVSEGGSLFGSAGWVYRMMPRARGELG